VVVANTIGVDAGGRPSFTASGLTQGQMMQDHVTILIPSVEDPTQVPPNQIALDLPAYLGLQAHGVVVIGSAGNLIGMQGNGNLIGGNNVTGIYLTSHDFQGNTYAQPFNNQILANMIVGNGMYGVYRYDAPSAGNVVATTGPARNTLTGNPMSIADYISGVTNAGPVQPNPQSTMYPPGVKPPLNPFAAGSAAGSNSNSGGGSGTRKQGKHVKSPRVVHRKPKPRKHVATAPAKSAAHRSAHPGVVVHPAKSLRPRVPQLVRPGQKLIQVRHPAIKTGK
jgi:hypothetical protein